MATARLKIEDAPNGEQTTPDGTEKVPVSGSMYVLISSIASYIRTLTQTLTGKTIDLTDNTVTGTKAQFDTACSDGNFLYQGGTFTTGFNANSQTFSNASLSGASLASSMNLNGQSFTSAVRVSEQLLLTGDISPSQITSNQDDYNPTGLSTASVLRLSTDASRNITSIAGGADGRMLIIHNVGSQDIVLKDDDSATGTAINRFALPGDITLVPDACAIIQYDSTTTRWRVLSKTP